MKKSLIVALALSSTASFANEPTSVSHTSSNTGAQQFEIELDQNAPRAIQQIQGAGSPLYISTTLSPNYPGSDLLCSLTPNGEANGGSIWDAGNGRKFAIYGSSACLAIKKCLQKDLPSSDAVYWHIFDPKKITLEFTYGSQSISHVVLPSSCD